MLVSPITSNARKHAMQDDHDLKDSGNSVQLNDHTKRRKKKPKFVPKPGFTPANPHDPPFIAPKELGKHVDPVNDAWICVGDRIYDVTAFLRVHPGGGSIIESFLGKQCDWQFERFHGKPQLTTWADRLLVGKTYPPPRNEFAEPSRWINTSSTA